MLHYTSNGVGNTIVLIHGFCENSTCFNEQVFFLQDYCNVITIDLPGHGQSPEMNAFSMEDVADSVCEILDAEKVSSCVMIGHSMGGYVTLAFAKKYPERLKGFGLLNSTANADSDERKTKREQAIRLIQQTGADLYVRNFIPPLYADGFSAEIIAQRQTANKDISAKTLIACLTAMKNREDSNTFLTQTRLPVGFFIGKKDGLIPMQDMLKQATFVKTASVTLLNQTAHMGMLEEPQKVVERIKVFADFCFS